MEIGKINFYNRTYYSIKSQTAQISDNKPQNNNIETSIYKQKGVNIPFCGLAKGADEIEDACIKTLRKVRENRCRKYTENDIQEVLTSLRQIKKPEEKQHVLEEILQIEDEESGRKLDKNFIKNIININANRPEQDRFAVLEFAQYELSNAAEPLTSFSKLKKEQQEKLIPILKAIDNIDSLKTFKNHQDRNDTISELYDTFRIPVYAHEDLARLGGSEANDYKTEYLKILYNEKNQMKEKDIFTNNYEKYKVSSITENIFNYFMENIL